MIDLTVPPTNILDDLRSRAPVGLLSRQEKDRQIERGFLGLYRWYTARSQETRNWNPDKSFDWRKLRHDFSDPLMQILQGFFAVEYYTPDYVDEILNLVRRSSRAQPLSAPLGFRRRKARRHLGELAALFAPAQPRVYRVVQRRFALVGSPQPLGRRRFKEPRLHGVSGACHAAQLPEPASRSPTASPTNRSTRVTPTRCWPASRRPSPSMKPPTTTSF